MKVKEALLKALMDAPEAYITGSRLAEQLGCSRMAVSKAATALEKEGFCIERHSRKGYKLLSWSDTLTEAGILSYLDSASPPLRIRVFDRIDSTNDAIKRSHQQGSVREGDVYIANRQTKGKGRLGRSFFSPEDVGLYLSIFLEPDFAIQKTPQLTLLAATAAAEAVEAIVKERVGIKWVNDLYLHKKKVCGILTEASASVEAQRLEYAVVGVGFNVYAPKEGFPEGICNKAGALFAHRDAKPYARIQLAAEFLKRFFSYYARFDTKDFLQGYKERSFVLGQHITYQEGNQKREALATDVTDEGALVVMCNGEEHVLQSGEIQLLEWEE